MNNRRIIYIALMFLAIIVACVVPGLPTATPPISAPTVDTGQIEEMVASTVSAAIALTEQSVPSPTPIPLSSSTSTPTSTITSDSTPTSTFTSAPTTTSTTVPIATPTLQPSPSQSTLTKQEDGSMLFSDERAGYTIKLPAGWLVVRVNGQEYQEALSKETSNANIQQSLLGVKDADPNAFRLLAIDTQAVHIQNEFVSDIRFVLDEKKAISLGTDADLQAIAREIPASATVFRFEVTSVKISSAASGMPFGVIEAKSSFANAAGADVIIYQKQVFFKVKAGTQTITFTTLADLKGTLLPVFDAMLETVNVK